MRECSRVGIDDCKEANGVTYCYCRGNMCNTPERKLLDVKELYTPSKNMMSIEGSADYSLPGFSAQNLHYLHDDEDLSSDSEGSGDEYAEFYYDDYMYDKELLGEYHDQKNSDLYFSEYNQNY